MHEDVNAQSGLVHGFVLDGQGGARRLAREALDSLSLQPEESLWLHWDRSHPQTQTWLRKSSGLSEFACDLLLEENTRGSDYLFRYGGEEFVVVLGSVGRTEAVAIANALRRTLEQNPLPLPDGGHLPLTASIA